VHEYGAGDSIEVVRESGATVMVPFTRATVPEVDLAAGRLVIEPLDGLLDDRTGENEAGDDEGDTPLPPGEGAAREAGG